MSGCAHSQITAFRSCCFEYRYAFLGFYPSMGDVTCIGGTHPAWAEDWEVIFSSFLMHAGSKSKKIVNSIEDMPSSLLMGQAYDFYYLLRFCRDVPEWTFTRRTHRRCNSICDSAIQYIAANIESRPIYFSERPSQLASKYKITRAGSDLFRIEKK